VECTEGTIGYRDISFLAFWGDVKITKRFTITSEKKLGIFLNDNGFKIKPQFSVLNDDRFFLLHAEKEDNNEWSE